MWIAVAQSCPDCNKTAAQIFFSKPTSEDLYELEATIGGMYCINTVVQECDQDFLNGGKPLTFTDFVK